MAVLLTQNWDIIPGKEDQYEEFVAKKYIPKCTDMGLKSVGGFYVEVGFGPRIISLKSAKTLSDLYQVMAGSSFMELNRELKEYIINYHSKIQEPTGRVRHEEYKIQKGVWKYNQYYDLIPGKKEEYAYFIINEHLPTMDKIDYVEVTGGWNVLVGGSCEIIAEFTFKTPVDIGRLLDNQDFRRVTQKLRQDYVVNYASRIIRTTERFEEPRWYRL